MVEFFTGNTFGVVMCCLLLAAVALLVFQTIRSKSALSKAEKAARVRTAELEEQTAMARSAAHAKGEFLSRMSHEIRTPLNAIIGMSHIARNTQDMEQIQDSLAKVEASSKHLLGIVSNILDFSKLDSSKMELEEELFSLRDDIEFVAAMFQDRLKEKNVKLVTNIKDIRHDGLITDSLRLNQVLINLLSNAVKFTDEGEIRLMVEELFYGSGEGVYRFSVSDTGIGIAPEQAPKLFTSFTQASSDTSRLFGGTGLGLAISQSLVALMGGEIELETELGQGSHFSFTIRVKAQEFAQKEKSKRLLAEDLDLRGKRILAVDDIEINREIIIELLRDTGAIIEVAENGKQALDMFTASPINHFNLILMDLQMPIMDGYTAAKQIRMLNRPDAAYIVIAAVSANAMQEDVELATHVGMNGYLVKPINAEDMYKKIGEWL